MCVAKGAGKIVAGCSHKIVSVAKPSILKHFSASPPLFQKTLSTFTQVFKGLFYGFRDRVGVFYIINWRNTLENPVNHLCSF